MSKFKVMYHLSIALALLSTVPLVVCATFIEKQPSNALNFTVGTFLSMGLMFVFILIAVIIMLTHSTFKCGRCGMEFQGKSFDILRGAHTQNKRVMTCPHCGAHGICDHEIR